MSPTKNDQSLAELPVSVSYVENSNEVQVTDREQYILQRHGTLNLEPLPSASHKDPLNWPKWKKNIQIFMVVCHASICTFCAAGVIPAFPNLALRYAISVHKAAYLCSILFLGIFPCFWKPVSSRFGRLPVFVISAFGSCVCNIAGFFCKTYGAQMATRALFAILCCPPLGFGSAVVTELFFSHERAQKMGWWTVMITLGISVGPIVMGPVIQHVGVDWIFGIFAIINFVQLLGYLFFGHETLYDRLSSFSSSSSSSLSAQPSSMPRRSKLAFRRLDTTPFTVYEFFSPLTVWRFPSVTFPAVAHAMVFCYANTAIAVELPSQFAELFGFNAQQIGLQYFSIAIGCILGEQLGCPLSDAFLNRVFRKTGRHRPVRRLWIAYIGFATSIAGIIVWGVQLQKLSEVAHPKWNVTPLVGAAIANFGSQVVNTVLVTFAIDNYEEKSAEVGIFMTMLRQIWVFIGPFYFPDLYRKLGFTDTSVVFCGLVIAVGFIPVGVVHWAVHSRVERL